MKPSAREPRDTSPRGSDTDRFASPRVRVATADVVRHIDEDVVATVGVNRTEQLRSRLARTRVTRWERNSTYDPGAYQGGRAMGV